MEIIFDGLDNAAEILNEHEFKGCLMRLLPELDTFVKVSLVQKRPVPVSPLRERTVYNYPQWALRELMMNAIMHRDYASNTPTKVYQYSDRIEIVNAGGLYGNARPENFPYINDYRNPIVAEGMKYLKYVNKYNRGISRVQDELMENGNGKAEFSVDKITVFEVKISDASKYDEDVVENATDVVENATNVVENATDVVDTATDVVDTATDVVENATNVVETATDVLNAATDVVDTAIDRHKNIIEEIVKDNNISGKQLANILNVSVRTIQRDIKTLKDKKVLCRNGSNNGGKWIIIKN